MRRTLSIALTILVAASIPAEEINAILNNGFEESFYGYATGWTGEAFKVSENASQFYVTDRLSRTGARSFVIRNDEPNDSRVIQWVNVLPSSVYKLECWVLTRDIAGQDSGASICVMGQAASPEFVQDTEDEWKPITVYGRTGPGQTVMPVALRLGFYGKLAKGSAAFDDVGATRVESVPEGVVLYDFNDSGALSTIVPASGLVPLSSIVAILVAMGATLLFLALYVFRFKLLDFAIGIMEGGGDDGFRGGSKAGEKRLSLRISADIPAFLEMPAEGGVSRIMELRTRDISRDGCLVLTDDLDSMEIGDRAAIAFKVGKRRFRVGLAQVVRKQKGVTRSGGVKEMGLGMRFVSRSSADRVRVTRVLRAIQKDKEDRATEPPQGDAPVGNAADSIKARKGR